MYYKLSMTIQEKLLAAMNSFVDSNDNKIIIKTNLKCGIPTKDIHKIAGPLIDQWVFEKLESISKTPNNPYGIIDVQSKCSSSLEDIFITISIDNTIYDVLIDVKSASLEKGDNAGKGSNLTSFRKIRPHYNNNPNSTFLILSIKHDAYFTNDIREGLQIIGCNIFDLKLVNEDELKLNTSMGDQFQISNSMKVNQKKRTTDEFLALIDAKYEFAYSKAKLENLLKEFKSNEEFNNKVSLVLNYISTLDNSFTKMDIINSMDIDKKTTDRIFDKLKKDNLITLISRRGLYSFVN